MSTKVTSLRKQTAKKGLKSVNPRRVHRFLSTKPELDLWISDGAQAAIVDAARQYLILFGAEKMSMNDVARTANLSRSSVYKYFADRKTLLNAVYSLAFAAFTADMDDAMQMFDELGDQLIAAAIVVRKWDRAIRNARGGSMLSRDELSSIITEGSEKMMRSMIEIVRRYLAVAAAAGELRADADLDLTAEWVARILHSLSANPPIGFDGDNVDSVASFLRPNLLYGIAAQPR